VAYWGQSAPSLRHVSPTGLWVHALVHWVPTLEADRVGSRPERSQAPFTLRPLFLGESKVGPRGTARASWCQSPDRCWSGRSRRLCSHHYSCGVGSPRQTDRRCRGSARCAVSNWGIPWPCSPRIVIFAGAFVQHFDRLLPIPELKPLPDVLVSEPA